MSSCRADGLDVCFDLEQRWKQDGIEGAPGKEGALWKQKLMLGRQERDPPADDIALHVKLGIRDAGQMRHQVLLAYL